MEQFGLIGCVGVGVWVWVCGCVGVCFLLSLKRNLERPPFGPLPHFSFPSPPPPLAEPSFQLGHLCSQHQPEQALLDADLSTDFSLVRVDRCLDLDLIGSHNTHLVMFNVVVWLCCCVMLHLWRGVWDPSITHFINSISHQSSVIIIQKLCGGHSSCTPPPPHTQQSTPPSHIKLWLTSMTDSPERTPTPTPPPASPLSAVVAAPSPAPVPVNNNNNNNNNGVSLASIVQLLHESFFLRWVNGWTNGWTSGVDVRRLPEMHCALNQ